MTTRQWGQWTIHDDGKSLHCVQDGREMYWIDLSYVKTAGGLLDWIFQVSQKTWATGECVRDLLMALEEIFHPQETLCLSSDQQLPSSYLNKWEKK